ncbi:MAG TPA: CHAT domain-containing protein [Ornithinicoccus sp.]|nr:CHAT domain-containing protein [Ornithinicoccus sp.]
MSRLVFSIVGQQTADGTVLGIVLKEPPRFGKNWAPLGVSLAAPAFQALHGVPPEGAVRAAGRALFDAVMANKDLAPHLTAALQVQPPERYPVFVELTTPGAENFPWEALCSQEGDFLGLDERWAGGRIVETISPLPGVWRFEPPLRVAAVLSCLGVPAADEWAALRDACAATGLPVRLLVLVSEEALHEEIAAAGLDWVTVEFVPPTVQEIGERLQMFDAHVLHMFCHGLSTETSPHLQVAVRSDWLTATSSSLMVEAQDIRTFNPRVGGLPWLVVLNSCETAGASGEEAVRSLALDLIYEGGVPAVVAMREPVRSDDAVLFTGAFYDQLLPEFEKLLHDATENDPVDWARLMVGARHQLAEQYEPLSDQLGTKKEWTLPVVYTRPAVFRLQVGHTVDAQVAAPSLPSTPNPAARVPAAPAPPATPPGGEPTTGAEATTGAQPSTAAPSEDAEESAAESPGGRPTGSPPVTPGQESVHSEPADLETTRSIALSIDALTGLRDQLAISGDSQMLSDVDQELSRLTDRLEGR